VPVKLSEAVEQTNLRICVYGASGVGKTRSILTLPGSVLVANVEGGLRVLQGTDREDIEVEQINTFHDFANLGAAIKSGQVLDCNGAPFTWLVLDSYSELTELLHQGAKKAAKGFEVYNRTVDSSQGTLQALKALPINILFLCKETRKEETITVGGEQLKNTYCKAKFPYGEITESLPYQFDFFLRLIAVDEVVSGKRQLVRYLQTGKTSDADAKVRETITAEPVALYEPVDYAALIAKLS